MSKHLYKYVGHGFIDKVFSGPEIVTLKCGYPTEFNDPYELFLTMDFTEKPELIAFYGDVVGDLPQLPTTCFSRSPSVVPMWAHYANNLQGFALELDEDELSRHFPESLFKDVTYQDEPSDAVAGNLYRAYVIGKFRYMHFLQASVFHAAYFTKQLCWSYEMERRMVADESEITKRDGMVLLDVPTSCIKSIVCGPRASEETVTVLRGHADSIGCRFLQMKIGRTSGIPFFVALSGEPTIFANGSFTHSPTFCSGCKEPIGSGAEQCSWCLIDDSHRENAAARNSYRLLHQHGLLEGYLEGINNIGRDQS
ncbi:DUF2971 domain-containing protein [Variovorax sp. YR752]|uniref:DUF2971 domain-containing protein n=1 Tax=Variovorax sp. YR752 TaxID=1884383 RepID=UPI0031378D88